MTVKEFLESTFNSSDRYQVRDKAVCADGYSVSIQGGTHSHYCSPRSHVNEYEAVELGFPSTADDELLKYAEDENDPTGSVYGYVPIDVIEAVIAKHGGIVGLPQAIETTASPSETAADKGILTEEELNKYLRYSKQDIGLSKILSDKVINSHIASLERNRLLVLENDELNAQVIKAKELMEWAARIIDSGMGAGILRYDPIQFFIDYHTYLKSLEELK